MRIALVHQLVAALLPAVIAAGPTTGPAPEQAPGPIPGSISGPIPGRPAAQAIPHPVTSPATQPVDTWRPVLFNAIKFLTPEQGPQTRRLIRELGIATMPMVYHGGVDRRADGVITEEDARKFANWVSKNLPPDYRGPVCLDYEEPHWHELCAKVISPDRLRQILDVYEQGLTVAQRIRPDIQWGYWGLPAIRHTTPAWKAMGNSMDPLLFKCGAVMPAAYDCVAGESNTEMFERYVSDILASARGQRDVYVFINGRFCGKHPPPGFIPDDELLANADAVLRASWTDPKTGRIHRIAGLVLWDAYNRSTPRDQWPEFDRRHARYFEKLRVLVDAHIAYAKR